MNPRDLEGQGRTGVKGRGPRALSCGPGAVTTEGSVDLVLPQPGRR